MKYFFSSISKSNHLVPTFLFGMLLLISLHGFSQLSEKGQPFALKYENSVKSAVSVPVYNAKAVNAEQLREEDSINGRPERYSVLEKATINIKDGAGAILNSAAGKMWQYKIKAPGAKSIQISFNKFIIPAGATLFLYDPSFHHVVGAFTERNVQEDGTFVIADFKGDNLLVEYFEPNIKDFDGQVIIGSIGKAYKDIFSPVQNTGSNIYININCPEGRNWQVQKHSVCMITFNDGTFGYQCTGSLINDVTQDGIPYFLTANHCISTSREANSMVAYFNYEYSGCEPDDTTLVSFPDQTISGATLLTTGSESDYTLLSLKHNPPPTFKPYFSGWDVSGNTFASSACIHHALGYSKRISIDIDSSVSYDKPVTWNDGGYSPPNTHWEVHFDEGNIFEGASGSALFDNNQRVVGQLHGVDLVGKLSHSWTHNNSGFRTLKSYLDPDGTNILVKNGFYPATNYPDAEFYSEINYSCINAPVKFFDNSPFATGGWKWGFVPNTILFQNGTSDTSKNPVVSFTQNGNYNVKLVASNSYASDSLTLYNNIIVGEGLNINILSYKDSLCLENFDSLVVWATGAASYQWSLINGTDSLATYRKISNDSIIVKRGSKLSEVTRTTGLNIKVVGTFGTCTDSTQFTINLLRQSNDSIKRAIPLNVGQNGPYSNFCTGIEENEPVPPSGSCTGQKSWCDEYGNGLNIIEHTVWFTLIGPPGGLVTIQAAGFDCEIALYSANSATDLVSGNYLLVAANDDRSTENFNPVLLNLNVTPGEKYWLQLDGSAGGAEGIFNITFDTVFVTAIPTEIHSDNKLSVYPQPASSSVNLKGNALLSGKLEIIIYSLTGAPLFEKEIENNGESVLNINTSDLKKGVYIINIISDGNSYITKLVIN
jgi:PKD repeat protein